MGVKLRHKTLSNGSKSYYLDIYNDGKREYEFLKIHINKNDSSTIKKEKKQLAESIRAQREIQIQSEEYGFVPKFKRNVDFLAFFEKYLEDYKGKDKRIVRYTLVKFQSFYQKSSLPSKELKPQLCEEFANYLKSPESGLNGETPYNYWTKFKRVIKEAIKKGFLQKNPAEGIIVKRAVGQLKKEVLTNTELQSLASTYCGNELVKKAFLFACFTGLGIAELRKLKWSQIRNKKIKLFREKTGEQIINDLHPICLELIGERGKPIQNIFSDLPSDVAIGKNLKLWVARAGIEKNISFYCGRHTFATQLLLNGANLKTVADCLGQTSTKHTLKYLNYVDALKSEAISSLPSIKLV